MKKKEDRDFVLHRAKEARKREGSRVIIRGVEGKGNKTVEISSERIDWPEL